MPGTAPKDGSLAKAQMLRSAGLDSVTRCSTELQAFGQDCYVFSLPHSALRVQRSALNKIHFNIYIKECSRLLP